VPIITLTALDKERDKLRMYKLGADEYFTKPIERDEMIKKIEEVLKRK